MAYVVIADWKGIRGHSGVRPKKGESELLEEILGKRKGTVEDRLGRVRNRLLAELEKRTATPQARASLGVVELERYFRLVTDALRAERDPRGGEETPMEVVTWLDAGSVGGNEG
jgi:hypothetical protein